MPSLFTARQTFGALATAVALSALTALPASAQDKPGAGPTAEQQRLAAAVRQIILDDPEIVREAFMKLRQREEAEQQARAADAIRQARSQLDGDQASPVVGNPSGSVTVVQFYDYNCGHCKRVAPALNELIRRDQDVKVVFKEFPILGEGSLYASRAALAAQKQGQFAAFHDELMQLPQVDAASVAALAQRLKLDHQRLLKDMASPDISAALDRNQALASQLGINGTPAFVIGNRLVPGAMDATQMAALVTVERAKQRQQ